MLRLFALAALGEAARQSSRTAGQLQPSQFQLKEEDFLQILGERSFASRAKVERADCEFTPLDTSRTSGKTVEAESADIGTTNCALRSEVYMCSFPLPSVPGLAGKSVDGAVLNGDMQFFNEHVLSAGENVWLLEFYADWCPHCKAFAPSWMRLGVALRETNAKTRLVSVNCEVHQELCQKNNVMGYPGIKWFYNGTDPAVRSALGRFYEEAVDQELADRALVIMKFVIARGMTPEQAEELLVEANYLPPKPAHTLAESGAVQGTVPHSVGDAKLISLFRELPETHSNIDGIVAAVEAAQDEPVLTCPKSRPQGDGWPQTGWPQAEKSFTSERLKDASYMVGYTLKKWVTPMPRPRKDMTAFDANDLSAVKVWLEVLAGNFPAARTELAEMLQMVQATDKLCVSTWLSSVEQLQRALGAETGASCSTDTCRVWTMFHFLTLAERRNQTGALPQQDTITGIMTFVANYLRCDHCRSHALEQYGQGSYGRDAQLEKPFGLPIYLWRFHSAVSVRIAAEGGCSGDRRWPPVDLCPKCWKQSNEDWDVLFEAKELFADRAGGGLNAAGALPDEEEVLHFLETAFAVDAIPAGGV